MKADWKFEIQGSQRCLTIAAHSLFETYHKNPQNDTIFWMTIHANIKAVNAYSTNCVTKNILRKNIINICDAKLKFMPNLQGYKFYKYQNYRNSIVNIQRMFETKNK